ncbi:hypothetical protein [Fischerella thermalis]|uniref:hypothetical protein n=1 Tax=Fischerella thermalis TaxID=372787 RepID=UPI0015E09BA4|nr:hypothetical protein [Fischerella thermalis]
MRHQRSVEVLKTQLSIEPIRTDSVTFLSTPGQILYLEFQVKLVADTTTIGGDR